MGKSRTLVWCVLLTGLGPCLLLAAELDDRDPAYYHTGELAGSLRSADPLPLYDADRQHLWNRLFAAVAIRRSHLPSKRGGTPVARIEGGDKIEFLAWPGTTYWDEPETVTLLENLLDQFLNQKGEQLSTDPLRRVMLQRDLWAAFDFLIGQNIARRGDLETRRRRTQLCRRLARVIRALALPVETLARLPDNYALAIQSGRFAATHEFDPRRDYLPGRLISDADEWQELDFHQPKLHEDIERRFVFLHTRAFRGRSYFRVFYRFPQGRRQLEDYLRQVDAVGVDWRTAGQNGFIVLKPDVPQIPAGTEVALLQYLIALDSNLQPTPTSLVESVRVTVFKSVDGEKDAATNTNQGINVAKYRDCSNDTGFLHPARAWCRVLTVSDRDAACSSRTMSRAIRP
ncbi:MAG: hypothetical protein EXS05_22535 [Planctomycetaceae bacterium]|nr:hypothetical protein [Planctomycetaceae bacterium]